MRKGIDIIKQVKEKLGKSADAGDYIDDFKKSDAPQFKGKSDKKKEKMAVAAYLDSKEEVEIQEAPPAGAVKVMYLVYEGLYQTAPGSSVKSDEEAKFTSQGRNALELIVKLTQRKEFKGKIAVPYGYGTTASFAVPKKTLLDKKRSLNDAVYLSATKETHIEFQNALKKEMSGIKLFKSSRRIGSQDYSKLYPSWLPIKAKEDKTFAQGYNEETDIQEARLPSFKDLVKYKYGDDHAGAIHFSKIGGKEYHWNYVGRKGGKYFVDNKPTPEIRVSRAGADSKINKVVKEETDMQESGHTDVASMKTQVQIATDALQKMNTELGKLSDEEDLPTWWTNKVATAVSKLDGMADYIDAKQDMGKTMTEEYKSLNESAIGCLQTAMIDNNKSLKKESKMGELFLDMQMDAQEMDEREFIKVYTKKGFQAAELKSLYKEFSEEVVKEVVDNSLMSQATRVISQTAIQEKIDPADVDNVATSGDRKAADKNIVFQLRRAQDMIKQTGRQDQTGVTFKDNPKKKEKIDIKVINKVLDMFDSLRPNDKAKMQTTIGKSYRDLLKTVQRGR
jgi:hypothetical protein